jgi:hypothetical protein
MVRTLSQLLPTFIVLWFAVKQTSELFYLALQLVHQSIYILETVVAKGEQVLVESLQGV